MNARIIALIVVVLALVGGGFAFVSSQNGSAQAQQTPAASVAQVSPTPVPTVHYTPIPTPVPSPTATPVPTPVRYQVTGKLTNSSGATISMASVDAYAFDAGLCASINSGNATSAFGFRTRSDGSYTLLLTKGTYVLFMASGSSGEYWNGKPNTPAGCQSADKLTVDHDMTLDLVLR